MSNLRITAGPFSFTARFEEERAPKTVAAFRGLLPWKNRIIHVRWSGESCWIPLGGLDLGLPFENHTSFPAPGEILLYPGGISETEILFPYGSTRFASKVGQLAGIKPLGRPGTALDLVQFGRRHLLGVAVFVNFLGRGDEPDLNVVREGQIHFFVFGVLPETGAVF